jgi:uncharacterized protein (DUF1499 family)
MRVVHAALSALLLAPEIIVTPPSLRPCPPTPNCVSTVAERAEQRMEPLPFRGSPDEAMARLRRVVEGMPGARVIRADGRSLQATFTTRLLRFVDDVDLVVDDDASVVHFRSASRVGRGDLGTNRRRMTELARRFAASP